MAGSPRGIAFLYPGEGSGYAGIARDLYETSPAFRGGIDHCVGLAPSQDGRNLLEALYDSGNPFERPGATLLALFAVEYGLTELWRSWGIEPAIVAGYGAGEYAAACTAGILSAADALKLLDTRRRLREPTEPGASMAELLLREFDDVAGTIAFGQPRIPFASGLTGQIMGPQDFPRNYWWQQARAPVRFSEAVRSIFARGTRVFLVAGPQSPQAPIPAAGFPVHANVLSSLHTGEPDWPRMLETLKALYLSGFGVNWAGFDRGYPRSKIEAPTYPFQHRDYARVRLTAR